MTQPNTPGVEMPAATPAVMAPPRLPRVNLMPPEIAEAAAFRRFQMAMGAAVLAAVAVVGVLYVHEHGTVNSAKQQLTAAQAQHATLQSKLSTLSYVSKTYDQVAAKKAMLTEAMGDQIKWSDYLTDLSIKIPDGVWLTNVNANETAGPGGTTATSAAPGLLDPGIGSITFSGTAFSHDDVAAWLDMLAKERGWATPYFTNSTEALIGSKTIYNFSSSVNITAAAPNGRYAAKTGN